jgi:hypothetical protein
MMQKFRMWDSSIVGIIPQTQLPQLLGSIPVSGWRIGYPLIRLAQHPLKTSIRSAPRLNAEADKSFSADVIG